jgi:hypothetical protein
VSTNQPRRPARTPTGGQWAPMAHNEADVDLLQPDYAPEIARIGRAVRSALNSDEALSILDSHRETYGCDYGQGGCKVAARAIAKLLPDSKIQAIRLAGDDEPQHFVVAYRGVYIDRDGAQSRSRLLAATSRDCLVPQWQLSIEPVTEDELERSEAPDPTDEATGERLSEKLSALLAKRSALNRQRSRLRPAT